MDAWLKTLNVYGAFVRGEDQLRSSFPRTINGSAIMGEADYLVLPWVMPTFRFEKRTSLTAETWFADAGSQRPRSRERASAR